MAIIDAELMFSKDQKPDGGSEVIDLKAPGDAVGQELTIRVVVTETADPSEEGSVIIQLTTSDDGKNFDTVLMSGSISAAEMVKGAEIFCVRVPHGLKRYVSLNYQLESGNFDNAGKVTAYMSKEL